MADDEMVWVYSGWSDVRCPFCEGGMVRTDRGLRCTSCDWPNDFAKIAPTFCELVAANNIRHRVIPGTNYRGGMRLPNYEEVA